MTNEQLIQTAKEAMRNDTVLNKGIVELLCNALVAVTEQRDALVAEMAAIKAGQLFFMYSDETGFEIHKTQDAAIASAKDMIAVCREEAAQDGWPEDADTICWGVIMQKATELDFEEPSEKNGWIGWSEYKLNPELEAPATDAAIAALRAEGVEMLLTEKFKAEIAGALVDFDGVDDATLQTLIWSGQPPEPDGDVWHIEYMTRGYQVQKKIREFARQLRESKGANHA